MRNVMNLFQQPRVAAVWLAGGIADSCAPFDLSIDTLWIQVADSDAVAVAVTAAAQPPPFPGQHTRVWRGVRRAALPLIESAYLVTKYFDFFYLVGQIVYTLINGLKVSARYLRI